MRKEYTYQNKNSSRVVYESLLIALFINVPAINTIIASVIPSLSNGVMALLYLLIICLFIINYLIYYAKRIHVEKISSVIVVSTIIVAYILTCLSIGMQLSVYNLIIYIFLPLLIISKMDIDGELVIKFCTLIPLIGVPFFPMVFKQSNNSISMGLSYAFLPAVVFASSYLLVYSKENKLFTFAALIDLIYFVLIFLYGSRGVVLSGFIAVLFLWLIRKKMQYMCDKYFVIKIICISIAIIIIVIYRWQIIYSLYDFFYGNGITVEFFDKLIRLKKLGDIDNGRNYIDTVFFNEFFKRPLLGHGIKSFEYYTGIVYPHNFIYQMLFDIGVVGSLIIMGPLCLSTVRFFKRIEEYENSTLLITLICASVPGALFSGDLWLNPLLWLTYSLILRLEYRT